MGLGYFLDMKWYTEYMRLLATNRVLGKQDVFNIPVYVDGHENKGLVGELSNVKLCHTLANHSTMLGKKYAVFGKPRAESKILALWGAPVAPGRITTIYGEQF
jgi:hypothetical protein